MRDSVPFQAPPNTRVSREGDLLILTHVGSVGSALVLFLFGLAWFGIVLMIDAEPYYDSSPTIPPSASRYLIHKALPILDAPFQLESYVAFVLHIVPVPCFCLSVWGFVMKLRFVVSRHGITRHLWFFRRFDKDIRQGRLVLEITTEDQTVSLVWRWSLQIENASGKSADFFVYYGDRREAGLRRPALLQEARGFAQELSRMTGWPVEYRQAVEPIPTPTSSSD